VSRALLADGRLPATDCGSPRLLLTAAFGRSTTCSRGAAAASASWHPYVPWSCSWWSRRPRAAWLAGVVGEAGRQPREHRLACQPASAPGPWAWSIAQHWARTYARSARWTPRSASATATPQRRSQASPPRRSARPGRPRRGPRAPVRAPGAPRPAPIRRAARATISATSSGGETSSGPAHATWRRRGGGAGALGGTSPDGSLGDRRWPGLPMRWRSPRTAIRQLRPLRRGAVSERKAPGELVSPSVRRAWPVPASCPSSLPEPEGLQGKRAGHRYFAHRGPRRDRQRKGKPTSCENGPSTDP